MSASPTWLAPLEEQNALLPAWWSDAKKHHFEKFITQGFPTREDERFKYTDLSFFTTHHFKTPSVTATDELQKIIDAHRFSSQSILLVFVNGYFTPHLSDMSKLSQQVALCDLQEAVLKHPTWMKEYTLLREKMMSHPFVNLNASQTMSGLFFHLAPKTKLTTPIHLLSIATDQNVFIAHPAHFFVLGEGSDAMIVDEYVALTENPYCINNMNIFVTEKNASLDYYKIQQEGKKAMHFAHTIIQQKAESQVKLTYVGAGATFARDEVTVHLQEKGAHCKTAGFYRLNQDGQYIDYHLDIKHLSPRTQSEMLYKGILDKQSRAVFNGRLYVKEQAQKIQAYQANHHLLLSNLAEAYSKPELEIYADDVKCKHGASTGQIDQEALFYLRSRGLSKQLALSLLLKGFADEILQRIAHPVLCEKVEALLS